jgi:hypothetical protein
VSALSALAGHWVALLVWGLVASAAMATLLEAVQLLGFSRMSLPFLFGAFVSNDRRGSIVLGYGFYLVGGWLFALFYALCLETLDPSRWWVGACGGLLLGLGHGLFLVTVFLPLLPYVHPRLATDYDGPGALARLEPPGPFGLNYGRATPGVTVLAQALYGLIFGLGYGLATAAG